jgi:hypothetical protein
MEVGMRVSSSFHRNLAITLMAISATACSSTEGVLSFDPVHFQDQTGVVFVRQNVTPDAVMEALFEGRVVMDAAGCLRLDSPDASTIVWPEGFAMTVSSEEMLVHDAGGREIGRVGGTFRLGGGQLTSLQNVGVSAGDRQRAETHCPGIYWVVGDVP